MNTKVHIGSLSSETTASTITNAAQGDGRQVVSVKLVMSRRPDRSRGFAFVEMATDEEAQKAATEFNQYQMGGRSLTVNEARPKPEGGFGGGGGYGGNRGGGGGRREPRW